MDNGLWNRPGPLEAALRFVKYFYLAHIPLDVSCYTPFTTQEGWTEIVQFALQTSNLQEVFQSLSYLVTVALGVTRSSSSARAVIDVENLAPEITKTDVIVAKKLPVASHTPYTTIAVSVLKRVNSNTIARSPEKYRLKIAAEPATAVVKEEDVLIVMVAADSLHLSSEAVITEVALLKQ